MKNLLNLRIPSVAGILLLLVGVGVTSFLAQQGIIFQSHAAPDKIPENISITNVTTDSFTVAYTTQDAETGSIAYGTDEDEGSVAMDDRDQESQETTAYTTHHITVSDLSPSTTYFFTIISGDSSYQNGTDPYQVKTAEALDDDAPDENDITGNIVFADTTTTNEAIVVLTSDETQPLSALVDSDGSYNIPLEKVRSNDLSLFASPSADTIFTLSVYSPPATSTVKVALSNTAPVPQITLGQNYDFTVSEEPLTSDQSASESADLTPFPTTQASNGETPAIEILTPENQETFNDQQPSFTGTALPGETVEIEIHSDDPITTSVQADDTGSWEFRPTTPLAPGVHTITIKTKDASGILQTFTRSFTVYAQGSEFTEPSVSPAKTPTTTPKPKATATPEPTEEPTLTPTPELPSPTPILTSVPTPTRAPLPVTGSGDVVMGGILGLGAIIGGLLLFLLARGSML